uniref:Uncharacterized protein n=1 Tax=Chromera velia CCMP2878 TaxID=1169474 RepID=A0A0G4HVQ8_9ALVE|eukprot:Cvel_8896.t1-p1 / transcript=Cvel_8896.t1 / gene=Cvel_8896 / organism=Chromera_velia_CCMP2878 / gene_product=hypothetical protein / transcript_product=hypothetical protein / location=Cvel_scaffold500:75231-76842(+) / protein_length=89 / sequence_SO=supercontig / SO=protein_coding / is_pseudo=false
MMKSQTMMKQKQQKQRTPPPDVSLAAATALPLTVFLLVARVPASASSGTGEVREGVLKKGGAENLCPLRPETLTRPLLRNTASERSPYA